MANNPGSPIGSGTNPDTNSEGGHINPSAPSAGTEGWGMTSDERRVLSSNDPQDTRAGQMKGNPSDQQAAASQRASDAATTNQRPDEPGDIQADLSRRTSISAHSMNTSQGGTAQTFRCADMGNSDCRWETTGDTEDDVMQRVVEHARDGHGMTDWTDAFRDKVRDTIRHRRAA
jgi:predicted small metal-binding protein